MLDFQRQDEFFNLTSRRASVKHINVVNLITRGRKAGLNASELYLALNAQTTHDSSRQHGQSDTNGYVTRYTGQGQCSQQRLDELQKDNVDQ